MNFTGQAQLITGTISPLAAGAGTIVVLGGAGSGSVSADSQGVFTFSLVPDGNYSITPSRAGYTFTPASRAVTVAGANVTGVNFTAQAVPTYTLSGSITPAATGAGATVTLSGGATASTTANGSGNYTFSGLSNGQYTVTPSKAATAFTPASAVVTITDANVTQNFTATQIVAPSIDATVFIDRSNQSTSLVSPAMSTTAGNELLLASWRLTMPTPVARR